MSMKSRSFSNAFTLIELLVVMGIIVLMGALVVPAVSGTLKGNSMSQASQTLLAQFNAAQQLALAKGQTVEMRLILCGDTASAAVDQEPISTWRFRAIQLYSVQPNMDSATMDRVKQRYVPISKLDFLPDTVVMLGQAKFSTLCDRTNDKNFLADLPGDPDLKKALFPKLPRVGQSYRYFHFAFRPDGTTDLDGNTAWFVSLVGVTTKDNTNDLPNNFFTVMLDPTQGSTRTFRPM